VFDGNVTYIQYSAACKHTFLLIHQYHHSSLPHSFTSSLKPAHFTNLSRLFPLVGLLSMTRSLTISFELIVLSLVFSVTCCHMCTYATSMMSFRLSVCLSVTLVDCDQIVQQIVEIGT